MKRLFLIIVIALSIQVCEAQTDTVKKERTVYNEKFKWEMTIPANFENIDDAQYNQVQEKGKNALEKGTDKQIDVSSTRILAFKNTMSNLFDSTYQHYDPAISGDYLTNCKNVYEILYNTFKQQMPSGTKIDTAASTEMISNLLFQRFQGIMTLPNGAKLTFMVYNRLFDKDQFTASMLFIDQKNGDLLLNAWRNSKFKQN